MTKKLDCKRITSVTQLRRCGYGVEAIVKLKKPFINKLSGENIGPAVGAKGVVEGTFGSEPSVKWKVPGRYGTGPQVVPPEFLQVVKRSSKPEIIAKVPLGRVKDFIEGHRTGEIKGSKVLLWKSESIYDDAGYVIGDVGLELRGTIRGDSVEFTSHRLDMSAVPRSERYMARQSFESNDPMDEFSELKER